MHVICIAAFSGLVAWQRNFRSAVAEDLPGLSECYSHQIIVQLAVEQSSFAAALSVDPELTLMPREARASVQLSCS